jgi:hypothetical protein
MALNKRPSAIFLALALALALPAAAAPDHELKKVVGGYKVVLRIDRNPPVIGTNRVEITLEDAAGSRVTEAKVLVNYYMPPMPRMAPMNYKVEARLKNGKFVEKMKLIMSGPWIIAVKITRDGKTTTAKFSIDVP